MSIKEPVGIGGSGIPSDTNGSFPPSRVVVMGGGEYACWICQALKAIGADVFLISTSNENMKIPGVIVSGPMMKPEDEELPFCDALGSFDSLIDTIGDERNIGNNDDDDNFSVKAITSTRSSLVGKGGRIVQDLRKRHQCQNYISTLSRSQRIVRDNGLLFGPGKANDYIAAMGRAVSSKTNKICDIIPPSDFASRILIPLLERKITYKQPGSFEATKEILLRGWSLKDFWEFSTWPHEEKGAFNTFDRYGLPAGDAIERIFSDKVNSILLNEEEELTKQEPENVSKEKGNPFILDIEGVSDLENTVMLENRDAVIFLSAPFCRTCRYLYPRYARIARLGKDQFSGELTFAKADAIGKKGKELGKYLDVAAVPSFVLFRNGGKCINTYYLSNMSGLIISMHSCVCCSIEIYGRPLAISKLPSKKLSRAIEYLRSGLEWNDGLFRFMDEAEKRSNAKSSTERRRPPS